MGRGVAADQCHVFHPLNLQLLARQQPLPISWGLKSQSGEQPMHGVGLSRVQGAPDVQAAMSRVRAMSGGSAVVPDTVMGCALKSHVRKFTPILPSASARLAGYRHPSAAPHLPINPPTR